MKYKIILFLLAFSFLIPFVAGEEIRFVGQKDVTLDIREPCFNNGTYCSATTTCNFTSWKPNGNILVTNQIMTNKITYWNYTLNATHTSLIGDYEASISCCDGGACDSDTFFYKVTPSGHLFDQSESTIYGIILFVVIAIAVFFLFLMYQTEEPGVKLFFSLIGFTLMIATLGGGRIFLDYTSLSGGIVNIISGVLYLVILVFILSMMYIMVNQFRRAIQLMKAKKGFGTIEDPYNF